jgi:hypothetical protein
VLTASMTFYVVLFASRVDSLRTKLVASPRQA